MLKLQIVWPDGEIVRFPAGGNYEKDLHKLIANKITTKAVDEITSKLSEKYIIYRTKSFINDTIKRSLNEILNEAIAEAVLDFKKETYQGFANKV